MPGCQEYRVAIDGDTILGYEAWDSKEAHSASMQIPEVMELVSQAFPLMQGMPEMVFEGESI
jgi:quinol monooxygenase YgiN